MTCIGIMQGLGAQVGYGNATRRVCRATEQNVTALGCAALTSVAWELLVAALRHLALCSGIFGDVEEVAVEAMADELREVAGSWMARELETQRLNPVGLLIGHSNRVSTAWCHEATSWMSSERTSYSPCRWASTAVRWGLSRCTCGWLQVVSRLMAFSAKAFGHANWMVGAGLGAPKRHRCGATPTLSGSTTRSQRPAAQNGARGCQGRVVHTTWGSLDRWEELGAHDATAHELLGPARWGTLTRNGFQKP